MKRIITLTLMLCTVFTMSAQFSGSGTGTSSDPYRIFNADQLTQMRNFLNQEGVYFKLQNDINLTDWLADNYPTQGWQPIGSTSEPFKGTLDGNGKTISGFSITRTSADYIGLFAAVDGATIKDLTLKGNIQGKSYVGSLMGSGSATVTNYSFDGTVTGTGNYIGGVGGMQNTASSNLTVNATVKGAQHTGGIYGQGVGLTSVTFTGQVSGTSYTGGLAGQGSGTFSSCMMSGPVEGASYTGGLVGYATASISLENCTHQNNVTGTTYTGGIIGAISNSAVTLTSCYADGNVTGTTSVGGVCGQILNPANSTISGCNYWGNITGTSQLGGVIGKISTTTYSPVDFTETTSAGRKGTILFSNCFYKESNPRFEMGQLGVMGTFYKNIIFSSDIQNWVKETTTIKYLTWKETANDGNGYTEGYYYQSSCTAPCVVYNHYLNLTDADARVLVNLFNCSVAGNIFGTESYVGGIIGQDIENNGLLAHYTITDSKTIYYYKEGTHSTTSLTLKKYNRSYTTTSITDSYFSGNLSGTNYIGGIAGTKMGGQINKCYASASISGSQYVGGIAGSLAKQSTNTNENSLSANVSLCTKISGNTNVGRIYGATDGNFSIAELGTTNENRSIASAHVIINGSTQTISDNLQNGTAVGVSQLRYKANYVAWGWDFNNNWTIQETESFPYKNWQSAPPVLSDKLTSGATTISGKSADCGTIHLTTGDGKQYTATANASGDWSMTVPALHAGETITLYAKGNNNKEKSYIITSTAKFLGSGTEEDPYQIHSAYDLQGVFNGGYYKLMNDIDLSAWIQENSPSKGWTPCGSDATLIYIDGDNHKITGLWTNTTTSHIGLFNKLSGGYIKNLNVEVASGKKVKGGNNTGILVGWANNIDIINCSVKGDAEGTNYLGGIVGYIETDQETNVLSNLKYEGILTSSSAIGVGGIAGKCKLYNIYNVYANANISLESVNTAGCLFGNLDELKGMNTCSAIGSITSSGADSQIGGLAGQIVFNEQSTSDVLTQCTADVNIISTGERNKIGGIAGQTTYSGTNSLSLISQCSSFGDISATGTESISGGLVGDVIGTSIQDCYSSAEVEGSQYSGGLVGYVTNATINKCYSCGNTRGEYYGAGIAAQLKGTGAKVMNCVALNNELTFTHESSWAARVIGGYDEASGDPDGSNLALGTMQVSLNNVPVKKYDDLVEGTAKPETELKQQDTYEALGWNFDGVWTMPANGGYPVLRWQAETPEPEVTKGDMNGDGTFSITDVVLIIDVIAGFITDESRMAVADVNNDGSITITDCVATIDLIAAQVTSPQYAILKARAASSNTDRISALLQDGLMTIALDNEKQYTAFQMIVNMPDGMTLGRISMDKTRGTDHHIAVRNLNRGQYLITGFSAYNEELNGNCGNLFSVSTNGQANGDIIISNVEFVTTEAETCRLKDIYINSTPTGISAIVSQQTDIIYDLQGRRITTPVKGIYIVKGKKTIIK